MACCGCLMGCCATSTSQVKTNTSSGTTTLTETVVWTSRLSKSYKSIRIPAVVTTTKGTLLAFAEGRVGGLSDAGQINVLLKRSFDSGRTWSDQMIIWADGKNTCGNPAPVVDEITGTIWLALTWNLGTDFEDQIMDGSSFDVRHSYMTKSNDDGETWDTPWSISESTRRPHWRWYATGPGNGIQLTQGPYTARLLIPCNHSDHSDKTKHPYRSHVIYSDDHGESWKLGGIHEEKTNESAVVELTGGGVLQSMRSYHGRGTRAMAVSVNGGLSFASLYHADGVKTSAIQGSILRVEWQQDGTRSKIVLSNPASSRREKMRVYVSYDEGKSWPVSKEVYCGAAAYSCLVKLSDGRLGLLYEKDDYKTISFAVFSVDWLEQD